MDDTVTRRSCDRPVRQADATFSADHMTPIGTPVGRPGPLLRQSEATLTKRVVVTHPPLQACQRNRLPGIHPTSSYKSDSFPAIMRRHRRNHFCSDKRQGAPSTLAQARDGRADSTQWKCVSHHEISTNTPSHNSLNSLGVPMTLGCR
jgi:hypothetical protein